MRSLSETTIFQFFLFTAIFFVISTIPASAANRLLSVQVSRLPDELKDTDIRHDYIMTGVKYVGVIQAVSGHVVVAKGDLSLGYYAAPGDRLYEKNVIFTLAGSRCRFKLSGEDVVSMAQNTRIGIMTFNQNPLTKTKQSFFSMVRGKAMFYALRLFKHRGGASMQVETPTAVSGTGGTKWGVEVIEVGGSKPQTSLPIRVADLSDFWIRQIAVGNPPNIQTNVYSFQGTITVRSPLTGQTITLASGQGLYAGGRGLGEPFSTPPVVMNQFYLETNTDVE